jgi:hypothetical protein
MMSFIDIVLFLSVVRASRERDRRGKVRARDDRRHRGGGGGRGASGGLFMACAALAVALFQLFVYNGRGVDAQTGERRGEKDAHYCEFLFEIISATITFYFCISSKSAADREVRRIMYGRWHTGDGTSGGAGRGRRKSSSSSSSPTQTKMKQLANKRRKQQQKKQEAIRDEIGLGRRRQQQQRKARKTLRFADDVDNSVGGMVRQKHRLNGRTIMQDIDGDLALEMRAVSSSAPSSLIPTSVARSYNSSPAGGHGEGESLTGMMRVKKQKHTYSPSQANLLRH